MQPSAEKHKRPKLSDYKSNHSVEGQIHLDLSLIRPSSFRQGGSKSSGKSTPKVVHCHKKLAETSSSQVHAELLPNISTTERCVAVNIDIHHEYHHAVIDQEAFMVLDSSMTKFLILDYDTEKNTLKKIPLFVTRRHNIFFCSCDKDQAHFVNNMVDGGECDVDNLTSPCNHVSVVRQLYSAICVDTREDIDCGLDPTDTDHGYTMTKFETEDEDVSMTIDFMDGQIFEIPFLENHFVVAIPQSFSVVKISFGKITCLFCDKKDNCSHIIYINTLLQKYHDQDFPEILDQIYYKLHLYNKQPQYEIKYYSYKNIPFELPAEMKKQIIKKASDVFIEDDEGYKAIPLELICPFCHVALPPGCFEGKKVSTLITKYSCLPVTCYWKYCPNQSCGAVIHYDGRDDCVINFGNFLVHYEVLRDFMFQFLYSREHQFINGMYRTLRLCMFVTKTKYQTD